MSSLPFLTVHPWLPPLPGTWKLGAGRAMTLQPRKTGLLRVAGGRLWVTADGPHQGALNDLGDHILHAGDEMRLCARKRWVLEAWIGAGTAYFHWEPLPSGE